MAVTKSITGHMTAEISYKSIRVDEMGTAAEQNSVKKLTALAAGTGSAAINELYRDTITLAPNTTTLVPIGSFSDPFGEAAEMNAIKGLLIVNKDQTNAMVVGLTNSDADVWDDAIRGVDAGNAGSITIGPGGCFMLTSPLGGFAVGAADTGFYVRAAAAVEFDVVVLGIDS